MTCEDIDKIKQENEKLKYLVSKMYPICINRKRCTFADRLYIVEMIDELDIDINTINAFEPMYGVVKTEPHEDGEINPDLVRKIIMDKIVDKAVEKINEQRSMNADQEGA